MTTSCKISTFSLILGIFSVFLFAGPTHAGGGPANVLVLYNTHVPEAKDLAEYYVAKRNIPSRHLCPIADITPPGGLTPTPWGPVLGNESITFTQYKNIFLPQLESCVANLPQPDEINYIVTTRSLPYYIVLPQTLPGVGNFVSLESAIQVFNSKNVSTGATLVGHAQIRRATSADFPGHEPFHDALISNPYFFGKDLTVNPHDVDISLPNYSLKAESWNFPVSPLLKYFTASSNIARKATLPESFKRNKSLTDSGWDFSNNLFLVSRLDGFSYADAKKLVDSGVAGDGTTPNGELLCMEGAEPFRGARDVECKFATDILKSDGYNANYRAPFDSTLSGKTLIALFTGTSDLRSGIDGNTFLPGSIADQLTSVTAASPNFFCSTANATCDPKVEVQTSIGRYIRAGVSFVHGQVQEPNVHTFPNAGTMLLYTHGYNAAESFFLNQPNLYWMNLYLGDPLVAAYAVRPAVDISVSGNNTVTASAHHQNGIAKMKLYADGIRIAESNTGFLTFDLSGKIPNTQVELLAIAIANNAPSKRTVLHPDGNPTSIRQLAQPDVQGWVAKTVTVGEKTPPSPPPPEPKIQTIRRAEAITSLVESAAFHYGWAPMVIDHYASDSCFNDVQAGEWFTPFVCFAQDHHWIGNSFASTFRPYEPLQFIDAVKSTLEAFQFWYGMDVTDDTQIIDWAIHDGLLPATDYNRNPHSLITPTELENLTENAMTAQGETLSSWLDGAPTKDH